MVTIAHCSTTGVRHLLVSSGDTGAVSTGTLHLAMGTDVTPVTGATGDTVTLATDTVTTLVT